MAAIFLARKPDRFQDETCSVENRLAFSTTRVADRRWIRLAPLSTLWPQVRRSGRLTTRASPSTPSSSAWAA